MITTILLEVLDNIELDIKLNSYEKIYLEDMIGNKSQVFDKITTELNKQNYEFHQLPQIISIISTIYNSNINEDLLENVDIINIVEFTINSLLDSKKIVITDANLYHIKIMIDSSIFLLRTNMRPIKIEKPWCFSLFCNKK